MANREQRIPSWMHCEIDAILVRFLTGSASSRDYWPRHMKVFLGILFNSLLANKPVFASLKQDEEQVRKLISVLEGPALYIIMPLRKLTNVLLLAIQRLDKEFVFDLPKRTFRPLHQALPSGEWPKNVRTIEDLQDSVSSTELSNDARVYLYKMLSPINNFQIQYDGGFAAVHSDPLTMKPIKIIVSPSDGAAVRELIETSDKGPT